LLSVQNLEKFTKLQERRSQSQNNWTHLNNKSSSDHHVIEVDETASAAAVDTSPHPPPANKAKEFDQVSIASSTHFTMVNGFGRSNIRTKSNSICRQGRQITVLIVTMSSLFMIAIIAVVYLMDSK
jgi:C1A family cysteine protease